MKMQTCVSLNDLWSGSRYRNLYHAKAHPVLESIVDILIAAKGETMDILLWAMVLYCSIKSCLCISKLHSMRMGRILQCRAFLQELSKVAGLQKKVEEVKGIMVDNIEQVELPSYQFASNEITK